jgi:hypothetical protein
MILAHPCPLKALLVTCEDTDRPGPRDRLLAQPHQLVRGCLSGWPGPACLRSRLEVTALPGSNARSIPQSPDLATCWHVPCARADLEVRLPQVEDAPRDQAGVSVAGKETDIRWPWKGTAGPRGTKPVTVYSTTVFTDAGREASSNSCEWASMVRACANHNSSATARLSQ